MKITDSTTFAELRAERLRLGITHLLVSERPKPNKPMTIEHLVDVSIVSEDGKMIRISGGTIEGTLDEAFRQREHEIAAKLRGGIYGEIEKP